MLVVQVSDSLNKFVLIIWNHFLTLNQHADKIFSQFKDVVSRSFQSLLEIKELLKVVQSDLLHASFVSLGSNEHTIQAVVFGMCSLLHQQILSAIILAD